MQRQFLVLVEYIERAKNRKEFARRESLVFLFQKYMKRKNNLYATMLDFNEIKQVFQTIKKQTKNKNKIYKWESIQSVLYSQVYNTLESRSYLPGKYTRFVIYEPKIRIIQSQNMFDKMVNHLVSKKILLPSIEPCLIDTNVTSRKGKGTEYARKKYFEYRNIMNRKYREYYILKCDIHHFFASIDHDILKEKLRRRIKERDSLDILDKIIDSTNDGLPIGAMTSQIFAIFYLNDLDHYIKENLKIKYYIRYQDDFVLIHEDKEYLKNCLAEISKKVQKEKLELNQKTRIYKNTDKMTFIGVRVNRKYANMDRTRKKYKKKLLEYIDGKIGFCSVLSSKISLEMRKEGYHEKKK